MFCTGFRLCDKPVVMTCAGCGRPLCAWHRRYTYCGNTLHAHRIEGEERRRIKDEQRGQAVVLAKSKKQGASIDIAAMNVALALLKSGASCETATRESGLRDWSVRQLYWKLGREAERTNVCKKCGEAAGWYRIREKVSANAYRTRLRCSGCRTIQKEGAA